jgi:hypothetical protein
VKPRTALKLASASRQLVVVLEILSEIDEKEYSVVVKIAGSKTKHIEKIKFSAETGGLFMMVFRVKELVEAVSFERD